MKTAAAAFLALALCAGTAIAQTPPKIAPRAKVEALAKAIDTQFFDEARAHRIAADLRAEARKGAYDKLTDPRDFAAALTERLRPLDGHFGVSWSPPAPPQAGPGGPGGPPSFLSRRGGYGFVAVRVLPGNIGYIDMRGFAHFEPDGDQAARQAADAALALTAGTDAVIFDQRDNGGGSPAMVGYLVGHFVPDGAKVYNTFKTRGEPDSDEAPSVPIKDRRLAVPLYVLTSGRTASAAESFAYTLQSAKRAIVVGEASAGGANPGGQQPLGDGLTVFISAGAPINPITGRNWEGTGVVPDVAVPAGEALVRAQQLALAKLSDPALGEPALTENRWALEALGAHPQVPPERLAAYAGGYGPFEVAMDGERLILRQGRRPPSVLTPLDEAGLFFVDGAPSRRVRFEPGALIFVSPSGSETRQMRNGAAAAGR